MFCDSFIVFVVDFFFFFKQKTAYEMRISDWSSDVCSSDLLMGDVDFLLKIVVPSVQDYEYFVWNKLSQIDGVQGISSSISMSQSINTTRLPIRAAQSR